MNDKNLTEWIELFNQCTPAERVETAILILKKIEAREDEIYNLCKDNPKHLHALPVDKLQEVARIANTEAHFFFMSALPNALDMLHALEGLTVFCVSDLEGMPTSELTEAIADIETVWKEAGGKSDVDLLTWKADLAGIPLENAQAHSRRHSKAAPINRLSPTSHFKSAETAKGKKRGTQSARIPTETKG